MQQQKNKQQQAPLIFTSSLNNTNKQQPIHSFKFKREQFSVNLRRSQRQQLFTKRRAIQKLPQQKQSQISQSSEQIEQMSEYYIQTNNNTAKINENNMKIDANNNAVVDDDNCFMDDQVIDYRYEKEIRQYRNRKYNEEMIDELKAAIWNQDMKMKHYGVIGIRKILSAVDHPPVQKVIDAGLLSQLFPHLQLQATWSLSNIATGTRQQCQLLVDYQMIQIFIHLLQSNIYGIVEQAMWGIGNLACDSTENRQKILDLNGLKYMLYAMNRAKTPYIVQHGAWVISNLCRGKVIPDYQIIKDGIFALIVIVSQNRIADKKILADCCWAISYSIKSQYDRIQILIECGFHHRIKGLLGEYDISIILPVLRIVGRMVMGDSQQLACVMNQPKIIDALVDKLSHPKLIVRVQACWALSNLAAGPRKYTQLLMTHQQLIGDLLTLMQTDSSEVRTEICHFFANLSIDGQPKKVITFYQQLRIIPFFISQLTDKDTKLVKAIIQDLYPLLAFGQSFKIQGQGNPIVNEIIGCGGNQVFQELQDHEDKEIYENISKLVCAFFDVENEMGE